MPRIRDLPDKELLEEWLYWDLEVRQTDRWGAALSVASEFREECDREIMRRRIPS